MDRGSRSCDKQIPMSEAGKSPISHDSVWGKFPPSDFYEGSPPSRERWWRRAASRLSREVSFFNKMKLTTAIALLLTCVSVLARDLRWRVHYSGGSGRDATALIKEGKVSIVPAESAAQARRDVMNMFPGAIVTSVSQIK